MSVIFVGGLADDISENELRSVFSRYGEVKQITLFPDGREYGFIEFANAREANLAIAGGAKINNQNLRVSLSHKNSHSRISQNDRNFRKRKNATVNKNAYSVKHAKGNSSNGSAPEIFCPDGDCQASLAVSPPFDETENLANVFSAISPRNTVPQSSNELRNSEGASSFKNVRPSPYFVDKTKFIEKVVTDTAATLLITAPSRFGKSVNLNTLRSFLSVEISSEGEISKPIKIENSPFQDTYIAKNKEFVAKHFQRYIVISVELSGKAANYDEALQIMRLKVAIEYETHEYVKSALDDEELKYFNNFIDQFVPIDPPDLQDSIFQLATFLHNYHTKKYKKEGRDEPIPKIILLADEFDAQVVNLMFHVDAVTLQDLCDVRDGMFGFATKDHDGGKLIVKTVLTGIADIRCLTGSMLGNVTRCPFLQSDYAPYYGFTSIELNNVLKKNDIPGLTFKKLNDYYNGYAWKSISLFNAWSVTQAMKGNACWQFFAEVSTLIMNFQPYLRCEYFKTMIEELINGNHYYCGQINFRMPLSAEEISKLTLNCNDETKDLNDLELLCILLFQNGWITKGSKEGQIRVPNEEIREKLHAEFYAKYFLKKYDIDEPKVNQCGYNFGQLIRGDLKVKKFCKSFHSLCFAPSGKTKYNLNHAFMQTLILMMSCKTTLKIKPIGVEFLVKDLETTYRCDHVFYCEPYLIIMELKFNETVEKALEQIRTSKYMNANETKFLLGEGDDFKKFVLFGINVHQKTHKTEVVLQLVAKDKETVEYTDEFTCDDREPAVGTSA